MLDDESKQKNSLISMKFWDHRHDYLRISRECLVDQEITKACLRIRSLPNSNQLYLSFVRELSTVLMTQEVDRKLIRLKNFIDDGGLEALLIILESNMENADIIEITCNLFKILVDYGQDLITSEMCIIFISILRIHIENSVIILCICNLISVLTVHNYKHSMTIYSHGGCGVFNSILRIHYKNIEIFQASCIAIMSMANDNKIIDRFCNSGLLGTMAFILKYSLLLPESSSIQLYHHQIGLVLKTLLLNIQNDLPVTVTGYTDLMSNEVITNRIAKFKSSSLLPFLQHIHSPVTNTTQSSNQTIVLREILAILQTNPQEPQPPQFQSLKIDISSVVDYISSICITAVSSTTTSPLTSSRTREKTINWVTNSSIKLQLSFQFARYIVAKDVKNHVELGSNSKILRTLLELLQSLLTFKTSEENTSSASLSTNHGDGPSRQTNHRDTNHSYSNSNTFGTSNNNSSNSNGNNSSGGEGSCCVHILVVEWFKFLCQYGFLESSRCEQNINFLGRIGLCECIVHILQSIMTQLATEPSPHTQFIPQKQQEQEKEVFSKEKDVGGKAFHQCLQLIYMLCVNNITNSMKFLRCGLLSVLSPMLHTDFIKPFHEHFVMCFCSLFPLPILRCSRSIFPRGESGLEALSSVVDKMSDMKVLSERTWRLKETLRENIEQTLILQRTVYRCCGFASVSFTSSYEHDDHDVIPLFTVHNHNHQRHQKQQRHHRQGVSGWSTVLSVIRREWSKFQDIMPQATLIISSRQFSTAIRQNDDALINGFLVTVKTQLQDHFDSSSTIRNVFQSLDSVLQEVIKVQHYQETLPPHYVQSIQSLIKQYTKTNLVSSIMAAIVHHMDDMGTVHVGLDLIIHIQECVIMNSMNMITGTITVIPSIEWGEQTEETVIEKNYQLVISIIRVHIFVPTILSRALQFLLYMPSYLRLLEVYLVDNSFVSLLLSVLRIHHTRHDVILPILKIINDIFKYEKAHDIQADQGLKEGPISVPGSAICDETVFPMTANLPSDSLTEGLFQENNNESMQTQHTTSYIDTDIGKQPSALSDLWPIENDYMSNVVYTKTLERIVKSISVANSIASISSGDCKKRKLIYTDFENANLDSELNNRSAPGNTIKDLEDYPEITTKEKAAVVTSVDCDHNIQRPTLCNQSRRESINWKGFGLWGILSLILQKNPEQENLVLISLQLVNRLLEQKYHEFDSFCSSLTDRFNKICGDILKRHHTDLHIMIITFEIYLKFLKSLQSRSGRTADDWLGLFEGFGVGFETSLVYLCDMCFYDAESSFPATSIPAENMGSQTKKHQLLQTDSDESSTLVSQLLFHAVEILRVFFSPNSNVSKGKDDVGIEATYHNYDLLLLTDEKFHQRKSVSDTSFTYLEEVIKELLMYPPLFPTSFTSFNSIKPAASDEYRSRVSLTASKILTHIQFLKAWV